MSKSGIFDSTAHSVVEDHLRNFELGWSPDSLAALRGEVAELPAEVRFSALVELVRVDMELRCETGRSADVAFYVSLFPELKENEDALSAIAFEEYRLACSDGGADRASSTRRMPDPEEYARRYSIDVSRWPVLERDGGSSGLQSRRGLQRLPRIGEELCGFRLVGLLGTGGCGKVFLARQGDLANRLVSLKVTTQQSRESLFLARLQHSNVVPIYSVHQVGGCNAICMPFLGLSTLKDLLQGARGPRNAEPLPRSSRALLSTINQQRVNSVLETIPDGEDRDRFRVLFSDGDEEPVRDNQATREAWTTTALNIAVEAMDGLAHAHSKGIVHGDVKPANILITDDGHPVLLDFHLSLQTSAGGLPGAWVGGTMPYMAPEQLHGFQSGVPVVDPRGDVWSAGIVLYEMLVGRLPWELPATSGDFQALAPQLISQRQSTEGVFDDPNAKRLNPDLKRMIHKCLAPDPARRYPSASELREDLWLHRANRTPRHAGSSGMTERTRKFLRRHPKLTSITTLSLISLLTIAFLSGLLVTRSSRLARADALAESRAFVEAVQRDPLDLAIISGNLSRLERAARETERLLGTWQADTPENLVSGTRFTRLSSEQQSNELEAARATRFWLAESYRRRATLASAEEEKTRLLSAAIDENREAEKLQHVGERRRGLDLQYAQILGEQGKAGEARRLENEATSLQPEFSDDWTMMAWLLRDKDASIEFAEKAVENTPLVFGAWLVAGNVMVGHQRFDEAKAYFSVATRLAPREPVAHYLAGRVAMDQGNLASAQSLLETAQALDSDNDTILLNLGLVYMGLGRFRDAEALFERAIELGTPFSRVWYLRADVRRRQGNELGAAKDFEKFLKTRPMDEISYVTRGAALVASEPDKAIADFRQALRLNPRSATALQNLAHVFSEVQKDLPQALETMDRLVALNPGDPVPIATRGVLYARHGQRELAHDDARKALQLRTDAEIRYRVAGIYAQTSTIESSDANMAFELIARAMLENPALVMNLMARDPDLEPLKPLGRWEKLSEALSRIAELANVPDRAGE